MASESILDQDSDFFLEELEVDKHLLDYHRIWSDPKSLIWSTQAPKRSLEETRVWLLRWTKMTDPRIQNYAIMLRPRSLLNPTNPSSQFGPAPDIQQHISRSSLAQHLLDVDCSFPRNYLIGQVGILRPGSQGPEIPNSSPEIGYMIHHTHWGHGLATRAVRTFFNYYWKVLNPPQDGRDGSMDLVEAHIDPANSASEHIAKKLAFIPGEWAGEEFRLASTSEVRKLKLWRVYRPTVID